jgi:hypothetical protein
MHKNCCAVPWNTECVDNRVRVPWKLPIQTPHRSLKHHGDMIPSGILGDHELACAIVSKSNAAVPSHWLLSSSSFLALHLSLSLRPSPSPSFPVESCLSSRCFSPPCPPLSTLSLSVLPLSALPVPVLTLSSLLSLFLPPISRQIPHSPASACSPKTFFPFGQLLGSRPGRASAYLHISMPVQRWWWQDCQWVMWRVHIF